MLYTLKHILHHSLALVITFTILIKYTIYEYITFEANMELISLGLFKIDK